MVKKRKSEISKEEKNRETTAEIDENSINKKHNKQLMWILISMFLLVFVVIVVPLAVSYFSNNFEYMGMDFKKTKMGAITFYAVNIPITDLDFNKIKDYPFQFREDPRELKDIIIDVPDKEVIFRRPQPTYITMASNLPICEDNILAVVGLTGFLKDFGGLNVKGALSNETNAKENNIFYANCITHPNNTVIMINYAEENSIKRTGLNCYELNFKDCDINKVTERFELMIIERYMQEL